MGEAPISGPSAAEWTYTGSATLKADPSTFRGYGENVGKIGQNLQEDLNGEVMLLRGGGKDVALSTGGFPEGVECDRLTSRNVSEFTSFLTSLSSDLSMALPSVAGILADLYETMDVGNGASLDTVHWAFGRAGMDRPGDLPEGYLEDPKTIEEYKQENAPPDTKPGDDVVVASGTFSGGNYVTYQTATGGTRRVVNTPAGSTETGYGKDGNLIYQVREKPDGTAVTENYADGELVSTTTRERETTTTDSVVHEKIQETTVYENGDQEPATRTDHIVTTKHEDGTQSREYYTVERSENENGERETERSGERYVGAQPPPKTMDDHLARTDAALADVERQTGRVG